MKIFVDFDNTIFDARHEFLEKFMDIFYYYGISRDVFSETYKLFSKTKIEKGIVYSPKQHIQRIKKSTGKNINEKVFTVEINEFLENLEEFVFEDFYQFVNTFNKKDLIILSFGDYDFQKQKIRGSGIEQFFSDVIITQQDKFKEIEKHMRNFPNEKVVLIDDKSSYFENAKKSDIDIETIHVLGDDNKCENSKYCDLNVRKLDEISDII